MRFFSNEAKDNVDDQEPGARPEHVQSDPVAVPPQRAGSPWQDAPVPVEGDAPPMHEPAAQPTAFGASTVGGAVAASAMAGPHTDPDSGDRTTGDRRTAADSGVADDRTVAPGDGVLDDDARTGSTAGQRDERADAVAWPAGEQTRDAGEPAGVGRTDDAVEAAVQDRGTFDDPQVAGERSHRTDDAVDAALEDRGTFDDPHVAGGPSGEKDEPAEAVIDEGDFDSPKAVGPASGRPLESTPVAPTGATAAQRLADSNDRLFPGADTDPLRERWRDVQLRFVDDPKGATDEAARLVDEAVDKLTAALRQQRGALAKGSDDTETLRQELRGYREILNRLLGL